MPRGLRASPWGGLVASSSCARGTCVPVYILMESEVCRGNAQVAGLNGDPRWEEASLLGKNALDTALSDIRWPLMLHYCTLLLHLQEI